MSTLYIISDEMGEGLFIQHGFATVIAAAVYWEKLLDQSTGYYRFFQ